MYQKYIFFRTPPKRHHSHHHSKRKKMKQPSTRTLIMAVVGLTAWLAAPTTALAQLEGHYAGTSASAGVDSRGDLTISYVIGSPYGASTGPSAIALLPSQAPPSRGSPPRLSRSSPRRCAYSPRLPTAGSRWKESKPLAAPAPSSSQFSGSAPWTYSQIGPMRRYASTRAGSQTESTCCV